MWEVLLLGCCVASEPGDEALDGGSGALLFQVARLEPRVVVVVACESQCR